MLTFNIIGLVIIAAGWLVQLASVVQGKKEIHNYFVLAYVLGTFILTVNNDGQGLDFVAAINIVNILLSGIILVKIYKK